MRCPKCHLENPPDSKFCKECGAQLLAEEEIKVFATKTLERPRDGLAAGSAFAGRYRIIEELGKGGMGVVYRALDKEVEEEVALKLLNPEVASEERTIRRFRNELKLARKISHKNVCRMYDIRQAEGIYYIVMEYVPGEDLKSLISKAGQLPLEEVVSIARQIGAGLAEAHRLGVVHRDLKPQNIMVDRQGNVQIMDFGIARSLEAKGITEEGMVIGTPDYMSPEQVEGKEADERSDIYSLGVILYEMLTGRVPFGGKTALSIALKHKTEFPPDPRTFNAQIPEALSHIMLKCMEKEKERRYQTVEEMLSALLKIEKPSSEAKSIPIEKEELKNSIAVLPFIDLSPGKDQEYFCDGLAEELINALSHVQDLHVVARSSTFSFKEKDIDIREVGKKLNVHTVLEGSVRKARDRLRITAQLINVADGYHLWSEKYDRNLEDIFTIQDEISLSIVNELKVKLLKGEKTKLVKRHTDNKEAFNLYLKGRYFWNRRHEGDMMKALQFYNQSLSQDPQYALPYLGTADVFFVLGLWAFIPPQEAYAKGREAINRALEIDDTIGEAYTSRGFFNFLYNWDWSGAENNFRRGIELNPNSAYTHGWYAVYLMAVKRFDEAIERTRQAVELEPLSPIINALYGAVLGFGDRVSKGREQLHKALEMEPNLPMGHLWLGMEYIIPEPVYEKAIEHLQRAADLGMTFALGFLGWAYGLAGKKDEAFKILKRLDEISKKRYVAPLLKAFVYFGLDLLDEAFEQLERSYQARDFFLAFLSHDPFLGLPLAPKVVSDPRFVELRKSIGMKEN